MKTMRVLVLVLLSIVIGAGLGVYGRNNFDGGRDSLGVNNHAIEVAMQLKVKAAVLHRLNRNDIPCTKKVLIQTIALDRKAIEQFRSSAKLDMVTLAQMEDAIELAGKSLSGIDVTNPELRCE